MAPLAILVVGSGIFGVTAALALARRGHGVRLVDRGPIPNPLAASTDISKLVRMDYGSDELYVELMERCLPTWEASDTLLGAPLYHPTGILVLSRAGLVRGGFEHESLVTLRGRGHAVEPVDRGDIQRRFPAWNLAASGYFNPRGGWAESGKIVAAYLRLAEAAGVAVRANCPVAGLHEEGGAVRGVCLSDGSVVTADRTVVAAGPWTSEFLPHLAAVLSIVGQPVLHFRPADPRPFEGPAFVPWAADIATTGWYGFPATTEGIVKIANHGPGTRLSAEGPRVVPSAAEGLFRAFLGEALPELSTAPLVGSRLCLYCDTFDGDFLIDADPDRPNLVVAAGGSGHAFKFAPALGDLIADAVEGRDNPFRSRFAWRAPGPRRTEAARFTGER